uniref:FAD-linked oxidase C-terminal domain-containing protein n=1 Tax=Microbulbifer agarilyticus TaxID=260552 RepID=UPI0002EDA6EF|nr:FAD-linked oxidase C-terminal domain-containing protein [Microbulbifer agarilyticus]
MSHIDSARTVDEQSFIAALKKVFHGERLLVSRENLSPYECDALPVYTTQALAVALAESEQDVVEALQLCRQFGIPVVSRGAGTGLSAGAKPIAGGLLLVTAPMKQILEVDPVAMTARVQPGAINQQLSIASAPHDLYYAPDPSSQIACSIGGNVAENAGGVHCLKYGVTVQNVLSVRLVSAAEENFGEVITLGSACLSQPGFDLLALVHGSEGGLGVITEVTVKLTPVPEHTRTLMADFASVRQAADAVSAIVRAGVIPAALEMMDKLAISATEAFCKAGYNLDAAGILLIDLDGHPLEVAAELAIVEKVLAESGAVTVHLAADDEQRARWWKGRKSAFPAIGRLSPDYYCIDGTVPRHRIGDVLEATERFAEKYALRVANVFHAGDGNLHPIIMFDGREPDALERTEKLAADILEYCIEVGGTITGEHGVGVEKINQMAVQFSDAELAQFRAIKSALDPHKLLNPDKQIPSLARCQEYRALRSCCG